MENSYSNIERQHVFDAVKYAVDNNLNLHISTGYDVIVNGQPFPPKEILRLAYFLANNEELGRIYGGVRVNQHFIRLGFEIRKKFSAWKLGCVWYSGGPNFFSYIREKSIAIGVEKYIYRPGDLILITEGYTVYALAQVKDHPIIVTAQPELEKDFENFGIHYEDWVNTVSVEWYDLSKKQVFQYKLQQGIRQVRNQDIIDKALDLWENRYREDEDLIFYSNNNNQRPAASWKYPCIVLSKIIHEDDGFYTSFYCFIYQDKNNKLLCGQVKILMEGEQSTKLPLSFRKLPSDYISLGQSESYYESIRYNTPFDYQKILSALNDVTISPLQINEVHNIPGFVDSLIRSSEAEKIFVASRIYDNEAISSKEEQNFQFRFSYKLDSAISAHEVHFDLMQKDDLPNRFFCLVGKNGTGKTKYVSQLAKKLANINEIGEFTPHRPLFTKVVAISFSVFDNFGFPKHQDINYELISLKNSDGIYDSEESNKALWASYRALNMDRARRIIWRAILERTLDLQDIDVDIESFDATNLRTFLEKIDKVFSSGQKITFHVFTRLLATIEKGSIVFFDEPETHLHPNVVSRMLNSLNIILERFKSFCIIATHSPVIIQEIPSKFVRVFERQRDMPIIFTPSIECFGENLTTINNAIFHVDEEEELYKVVFKKMATEKSLSEINALFDGKLSLNAQLYLKMISKEENDA